LGKKRGENTAPGGGQKSKGKDGLGKKGMNRSGGKPKREDGVVTFTG